LPNLAVFDQAAPLRGAGSGAPRAVPAGSFPLINLISISFAQS
jgi:hypothetical protein